MEKIKDLLSKRPAQIGAAIVLLLLVLVVGYSSVPQPKIDDGYLLADVRKVSLNAPFTIRFSQAMNRQSVEDHFVIKPSLKGHLEWVDSRTLTLVPDDLLTLGGEYEISVKANAKNRFGKKIGSLIKLKFEVAGPPVVKFIAPYLGDLYSENQSTTPLTIGPEQEVTVLFDRPIRSLTTLDESVDQDFPELEIFPPVEGEYKWVGTTGFQFLPDEWTLGTNYKLRLPAGIKTLDGGQTEDSILWHLATEAPLVSESMPDQGNDVFSVNGDIILKFNQPVDLDSIKPGENAQLFPSNDLNSASRTDGFFNTEVTYGKNEEGKQDRSILVFKPEFPYQNKTDYQFVLKAGLSALNESGVENVSTRVLEEDFILDFRTIDQPGIEKLWPTAGTQDYTERRIGIDFRSPMTEEEVRKSIEISPSTKKEPVIYLSNRGRHAEVIYTFEPSTSYVFDVKSGFKDVAGNVSDISAQTSFTTAARRSNLRLLQTGAYGFFMQGVDPIYTIRAVNIDSINVSLCRISEGTFYRHTRNYNWRQYNCPDGNRVTLPINAALNSTHLQDLNLSELFDEDFEDGMYFMKYSSPQYVDSNQIPRQAYKVFMISDTSLTLKKSGQDLLAWAVDLKTGEPVERMELSILNRDGVEQQRGVTDGNGLYKITKDLEDPLYILGSKKIGGEDRWAFVSQSWNSGIENWRFQSNTGDFVSYGEPRIYLTTDRPLYRPDDELFFKGIYRVDLDANLQLPADKQVKIIVEDAEYNEIHSVRAGILPDGSFHGQLAIPKEASLGRYNIYAETIRETGSQRFYHHFFVEEFKKPTFKVELLSDQTDIVAGDDLEVDVAASYFFGGPIQDGDVSWSLLRESTHFDRYRGDEPFVFGLWQDFYCFWIGCGSGVEIVDSGDGELDANGMLSLALPTDHDGEEGESYLYTVEVQVENQNGEFVSGRQSYTVHPATYYIGLNSKNYVYSQPSELPLKVITVDLDGEVVTGKRIALELYRQKWNTVKKQGVDGAFYDESVLEDEFVERKTITSEPEAQTITFDLDHQLEPGQYLIKARGSEGRRKVLTELQFYLSGSAFVNWGSSNNSRMELIPDRSDYFVGGKAKVLIKSPYGSAENPAKALITYERGGIQQYSVIDITSNSQTIQVPIDEKMLPNIYVSAMVVKGAGKAFDDYVEHQNYRQLSDRSKELNEIISELDDEIDELKDSEDNRELILKSRKEKQRSEAVGELEQVKEDLEAFGKIPDPVDFSLIKPDFKMGVTNLMINKREHDIVVDMRASQSSYNAGETAEIEIRTHDYQNRPVPANVMVAVVDESLLALKANRRKNPLDYFYASRQLQVDTATNLAIQVERIYVESANGDKGGDGGLDEGFAKKRGEFKDTAYFNPLVQTDEGGFAKVSFVLPDNLTTWQIAAVALSDQKDFGLGNADFVVRKPVSITPTLPRFAVGGDQLRIGGLVHNQRDDDLEMDVELLSDGLIINGSAIQTVRIPAGESKLIHWQVAALPVDAPKMIDVEFRSLHDTIAQKLPVKPLAVPEVVALSGQSLDIQTEQIQIPEGVMGEIGYLDVAVGQNLNLYIEDPLEQLELYPYECAEQVTSKLVPHLLLQLQSVELAQLEGRELEVIALIEDGLSKLSKLQRFDGGYGFWQGSGRSQPFLTAYVLYAQQLAREAGFSVSENRFDQAVQYLFKVLNQLPDESKLDRNERMFILWALSEAGQYDTGMTLKLFEERNQLKVYSHALMLMNLQNLIEAGQKSVRPFAERIQSEIVSNQIIHDRTVHFEEEEHLGWDLSTNNRTTAMVLAALSRDNGNNPILPMIVNYMIDSLRANSGLLNTQETAWTLMALMEYQKATDLEDTDYEFAVKLNKKTVLDGEVNEDNLGDAQTVRLPISDLETIPALNEVSFSKRGDGEMRYELVLKYFLPNEQIPARDQGLFITRDYYRFNNRDDNPPVDWMKSGNIYRGELNLIVPEDMHHVVVEELLPAGVEAINFELETTSQALKVQLEELDDSPTDYWWDNPLWHFNHREVRNDRVLLFADFLPKGVYTYDFLVRAGLPGIYSHLPASASQMYFPEVFGRTNGSLMEVRE